MAANAKMMESRVGDDKRLKMCKTNSSTTIQHFELDLDEACQKIKKIKKQVKKKDNNENRKTSNRNKSKPKTPTAASKRPY